MTKPESKMRVWWLDDMGMECCREREGSDIPHSMFAAIPKEDFDALLVECENLAKVLSIEAPQTHCAVVEALDCWEYFKKERGL